MKGRCSFATMQFHSRFYRDVYCSAPSSLARSSYNIKKTKPKKKLQKKKKEKHLEEINIYKEEEGCVNREKNGQHRRRRSSTSGWVSLSRIHFWPIFFFFFSSKGTHLFIPNKRGKTAFIHETNICIFIYNNIVYSIITRGDMFNDEIVF